ncbi:MAG TPA: hypothetical protein VG456_19120 [Candidatus Sulfopaludibacter sp.]|jgi:hypothetical protein|nr:hypothetical protein [Candidatus Sulfopaludibacter sp.]
MDLKFIRVHNKLVHVDAISFVEFLESGRAMIVAHGLHLEKQHIQVDVEETRRLRELLEPMTFNLASSPAPAAPPLQFRRFQNER